MSRRALFILLTGCLVTAVAAAESIPTASQPCYVVIAIDVSGGMERADTPADDARGRKYTLRGDAQLVCMQLLPYIHSDLYIGVCHFSDRVRYTMPSEETAPLLAWGGSYLNEAACRNMVRSPDFVGSFSTEIDRPLVWASARIQAARRQHGDGPGKIILLSRGDPRVSVRDMDRGPLLEAATQLAQQGIRIYPIVVNRASHRIGQATAEPSSTEQTAEEMLSKLASLTDGKIHRITATMHLPDILMDIFGLGTLLTEESPISRYDWATAIVGPVPASLGIMPIGQTTDVSARTWAVDERLEAGSGIRLSSVTSSQWQMTILRRPDTDSQIERAWEGYWRLSPRAGTRMYRIPGLALRLEPRPGSPWWANQQVRLATHVVDRHRGAGPGRRDNPSDLLSIRLTAQRQDQSEPWHLDDGRWTIPSRLYESDPFTIETFGLYDFRVELIHEMNTASVVLVDASSEALVHPPCIGLSILDASGQVLGSWSDASRSLSIEMHGGQPVSFRLSAEGAFGANPVSGTLHIEPHAHKNWPLQKDTGAVLVTEPIELPEAEKQLACWAEVEVETAAGLQPFRLPRFELVYRAAPVRIESTLTEPRTALWAGELHRQLLTVSAFPVFETDRERVLAMFPETLSNIRIRTVDLTSGTAQVMTPQGYLVEVPKPTGANGRTLTATYALESPIPLPRADQCEISLEGSIEGLQGGVKTYAVVDPMANGLFKWTVHQAGDEGPAQGLAETIHCGEPVRLAAEWKEDQGVLAVRFEIVRPEPDAPLVVDLPIGPGNLHASVETTLPGLQSGQTYLVHAYVTVRSSGATAPVEAKIRCGRFTARDRRLLLEELVVGDAAGRDIASHPWEPVRIPLRVAFAGYIAGNVQHTELIDRVKTSCRVTVTSPGGEMQDLTESIEWTALVASDTREGRATRCELQGYAPYVPRHIGRAAVEMTAEFSREQAASPLQRANGYLAIREPRLALSVERLTSSQQDSLFDSQTWATSAGGLSPVTTQLSTRLRLTVRPIHWNTAAPSTIALRVLRRPSSEAPWTVAMSTEGKLSAGVPLTHEVQIADNGQYAVEMVGRDQQSGQVVASLTTPVLLSIHPHEIVTVLSPAAWITHHVRRWPFEYRVTIRKDSADTPQISAMAFQFRLPSAQPVWREGSVHAAGPDGPESLPLSLRGPELLPPLEAPEDGSVQFRLSSRGQELVQWEHPNVRVLPPVLERLTFTGHKTGPEVVSANGRIELDGSTGLWARPVFRAAPELAGQWIREQTTVYTWPCSDDTVAGMQLAMGRLEEREAAGTSTQAFRISGGEAEAAVRILPALARRGFWGWPKPATTKRYAIAASAMFQPSNAPNSSPIVEWTDVTVVNIVTTGVVPWCWWVLAGVIAALLAVFVLRLSAPRPDRLGVDVRLEEGVATVEPASLHSPVEIELGQTSLGIDIDLHVAHALSRSKGNGLRPFTVMLTTMGVILRRAAYPRRWAWALLTPRIGSGVTHVQKGLFCIWTGPLTRKGRAWSSQSGVIAIPEKGRSASIALDLAYEMAGAARSIRVSVRIRNGTPQTEERPTDADFGV